MNFLLKIPVLTFCFFCSIQPDMGGWLVTDNATAALTERKQAYGGFLARFDLIRSQWMGSRCNESERC